jgi:hypothetical protein
MISHSSKSWLFSDRRSDRRDPHPSNWLARMCRRFKDWLFEPISTQEWYINQSPPEKYNKEGDPPSKPSQPPHE